MHEVVVLCAVLILIWMLWLLLGAKQYNQFLRQLLDEVKPELILAIKADLAATQSQHTPNNDCHVEATILYWTRHKVRILQGAFVYGLLSEDWLSKPQNKRNFQHLLHVEQHLSVDTSAIAPRNKQSAPNNKPLISD